MLQPVSSLRLCESFVGVWYGLFTDVHPDMAYGASDPWGHVHNYLRKDAFL